MGARYEIEGAVVQSKRRGMRDVLEFEACERLRVAGRARLGRVGDLREFLRVGRLQIASDDRRSVRG